MKQARRHNDHGFTLTEMLVTVTIVIVLFALAMIPISKMRREVRQTELDSRAELIFMAAQNQLTQLQAAGRTSAYQGGLKLGYVPEDAENENEKYDADTLSYVTSDGGMESATSPAANILPEGKVDAELRNAHWVIEYDASSASVYAVFYSEQESNFYTADADKMNPLRARNYRLQQGAKIGYYGGDSVLSYDTSELDAKAEIVNGDQLLLKITCNRLLGESGFLDPTFTVTLRDESGHTAKVTLANNEIVKNARSIEATLVLDNLAEGELMRFAEQERFKSLVPGENLTISVNVSVDNDLVEPAVIENITTNSLFADARDGSNGRTAVITCGRHLQNLDQDSGLNDEKGRNTAFITAAVQEQDVEFKTEAEDGWKVLYDGMTFKPIENKNLTSYDSTYQSMSNAAAYHPVIYDLTAAVESGDAGLFAAFKGELKNIRLAGATITGSGSVGGLVGKLSGQTMIEGCWVYLSSARNHAADKTEKDLWLDGAVTGGLVGNAESGTLTIKNSFAATVLNGKEAAGGLIGKSGSVTIEHSYADCYVYTVEKGEDGSLAATAGKAGGLIGDCIDTSNIVLRDCYAAGFLKGGTTAGLVAGEFSGEGDMATNVYTACAPLDGTSLSYIIGKKEGVDAPGVQNVFYLSDVESNSAYNGLQRVSYADWSGSKIPDASKMLSDGTATAFTTATSTTPYNLMEGLGLTRYSYPALTDLPHYGDWQAQFENESLAYYEKYAEKSYGFSGGNISTLKTDGTVAVGDGYGLLYETKPAADVKVTVGGKTCTLEAKSQIEVIAVSKGENKTYYLLPLPADLVQEMGVGNSFYTKLTVAEGGKTFYYNPHFANTAAPGTDSDVPDTPERVEVRTARQLNALSAYYDKYVEDSLFAKNTAFVQGANIDYSRYDWQNFGKDGKDGKDGKSVSEQTPIGASAAQPFRYSYNGSSYQITGVSFTGKTCVGLFGYNTGTLSNIIITTDKPMNNEDGSVNSNAPTAKVTSTVWLNTVYVGVLAGWNQTGGVISNCAVSGYNLTGYAYSGSTSYVGGLVGFNAGAIRASSAVTPLIKGTGNLVQSLSIGGLVGGNGGQIRRSYALAAINVMEVSGNVTIAGFAGGNVGTIRDSYCATAMTSAGAATYGFAPASGSLNNCCFLTGGTYTFAGKVYLYDYDADVTVSGAAGLSSKELAKLSLDGFGAIADAAHSVNHPNTAIDGTEKAVYPYPGSVTGRDGARTHYGDWVTDADLGTLGVIYWEKEEGGSNDGYHFSFIGFENGAQQKADSSLCEAHDDGGKITDYGYGYYWKDTGNRPELKAALFPLSGVYDSGTFELGTASTGKTAGSAAAELEKQVPGYRFVTYQTGEGADRMRLLSSKTANGQWTLTQEDTGSNTKLTFRFLLNPFFANSYSYVDEKDVKTPGTEELAYQVRSVEQLQFINWSYDGKAANGSTTADVTSTNYKTFPYLQYATVTGKASQTKEDSLKGNDGGPRPIQTWKQTHDVNGTDLKNPTERDNNARFYPIAGAVVESTSKTENDSYSMLLYNWFGGKYDGQSYYIKNVRVESHCYNVGLFGTTVGADISNIVLYSDNDSIIQRKTERTKYPYNTNGPDSYQTFYALGGLVGIAYDYAPKNTSAAKGTINNCAIAGYVIQDNSQNKLRLGEAVVGGLFGVSSTNLENCSAVVDIEINCTHRWGTVTLKNWEKVPFKEGDLNSAKYGNFIRVGGLVGGLQLSATNCYTGGSITVSDETLKERVVSGNLSDLKDGTSYTEVVRSEAGSNDKRPTTYVYVAGVGGSGFAANFQNFTNESSTFDGAPRYYNCYTYMDLPDMKGTITGITLIGSAADRYSYTTATINNCYYLKSIKDNIKFSEASKCYFDDNNSEKSSSLYSYFNDQYSGQARIDAMLYGDMTHMRTHIGGGVKAITRDGLTGLTYAQMSDQTGSTGSIVTQNTSNNWPRSYDTFKDALNQKAQGPFDWVSVEENNASIHGKYSFPGSDSELRGQDYPFPTVLTQTDIFGATVHLHYGRWPKVGMFWKDGITTLDLIADYVQAAGKSQIETQLVLNNTGLTLDDGDIKNVTFTYGNGAMESDVASARVESVVSGTTPAFNVVLEGKAPGAVEVTATFTKNDKTYTARLTLTVTAELNVTLTPAIVDEYVGDETEVTLRALNSRNEAVTSNIVWALVSDDEKIAAASSVGADSTTKITGVSEGETSIHVTATVTLGGKTYTGTNVLGVTVSQQGVLGIANTASAEYVEGKLARDLKGWYKENATSAGGPAKKTYPDNGTAAPVCESTLFLYGRGQKAKLSSFDVTGITVTAKETTATGEIIDVPYDVLNQSNQSKYTVTVGTVSENGKDTVLPLTVRGRQQGEITLIVTLTDRRAEAAVAKYELSIPYTLTEADTQVTATFAGLNGEPIGTQTVKYGEWATISEELLETLKAALPEGSSFGNLSDPDSWEPSLTSPLYIDTVFRPKYEAGTASADDE